MDDACEGIGDGSKPPQRKWRRVWREWVRPILLVVIVLTAFRSAIADWNDVPTGSMNPTILEGDRIFVNKMAYDLRAPFTWWRLCSWGQPQHGEIITFISPEDGRLLVKRVVGVSGDVIEVRRGRLFVNEKAAHYERLGGDDDVPITVHCEGWEETLDDVAHPIQVCPVRPNGRDFGPQRLGGDEFFMMGDNRDNSYDSRFFGVVHRDRILGRVICVALSVDARHSYWPRWNRFFMKLQ